MEFKESGLVRISHILCESQFNPETVVARMKDEEETSGSWTHTYSNNISQGLTPHT